MSPRKTLLFLFLVLLFLSGIQYVVPRSLSISGIPIKIFNWESFFEQKVSIQQNQAQKDKLQKLQLQTDRFLNEDLLYTSDSGSLAHPGSSIGSTLPEISFHIDSASGIQYPGGDSTILYPFFASLDSLKEKNELSRILHFGDSQIEGDRVTGYLRQRLQQQFGGCGPGLVPFSEEEPSRFSVEVRSKDPVNRFLIYGKSLPLGHRNYSILHSAFRLESDSTNSKENIRNSFSYRLRNTGFKRASYFEKATLFCRNTKSEVNYSIGKGEKGKFLTKNDSLKIVDLPITGKMNRLFFEVNSSAGNDFYGFCLDCKSGIAVDNIPLRGSSGMELLKINPYFLQEQIRRLNVKLVILEFGINVVPYESASFNWYESNLIKVIRAIKKSKPDVQVLIVGVSDMAKKIDGQWQSYPNIELIRIAQRNAAAKTNSAFWDLYQVMGGQNSILAWARTSPPLAGKDYIHLTPKGAQVVGEFLFQALENVRLKQKSI